MLILLYYTLKIYLQYPSFTEHKSYLQYKKFSKIFGQNFSLTKHVIQLCFNPQMHSQKFSNFSLELFKNVTSRFPMFET